MDNLFTVEGRLADMPDVQRTYMWELEIPGIGEIVKVKSAKPLPEELIIRCRSAQIPERGVEAITSSFGVMKQFFAGKPTFSNTLPVTFEETDDQLVFDVIQQWQQLLTDIRTGKSQVASKRGATRTIFLNQYKVNGDDMKYRYRFVNAWPQNRASAEVGYDSNDSVKYSVTFQFDYWDTVKTA